MLDVQSTARAAAHVRRPSCPPLMMPPSRSTFIPMDRQLAYKRHTSLDTDLVLDPDSPPAEPPLGARPKSKSLTTLQTVGKLPFSASPELRRKHWLSKIIRLRLDVDKIRLQFKKAGSNIRGGVQAMRRKLTPQQPKDKVEAERSIVVHYVKDKYQRQSLLANDGFEDLSLSETNFSSSMVLTSLDNGKFKGVMSLDYLPLGDIRILISNYKLEIILVRKTASSGTNDHKNKVCHPRKIGEIDIPIYVNPASLTFQLDDDNDSLLIEGIMKGYFDKCLSVSSNDIRVPKDYFSSPVGRRKKKKKSHDSRWYDFSNELTSSPDDTPNGSGEFDPVIPVDNETEDGAPKKIKAFRTRSNTN